MRVEAVADTQPAEADSFFDEVDWGEDLFDASFDFADNPESRCPCVLLLDTSESMAGAALAALRQGLEVFRKEVLASPLARRRLEVAIVAFGSSVQVVQDFASVDHFLPPVLQAGGETPMGGGLLAALDLLDKRKAAYRANGVPFSQPWLFLITDGMPQGEPLDVLRQAVQRLREEEARQRLTLFAVGVAGANMTLLARLARRPPLRLDGLRFADLFSWLSASVERLSCSRPGQSVVLPPVSWSAT
jgi:uncharacterized protein YegL